MTNAQFCEFCDGVVRRRRARTRFDYRGRTVYVDRVPVWVCSQCGERYFDAPVYKRLEQIARQRSRTERTVSFPLATYTSAPV